MKTIFIGIFGRTNTGKSSMINRLIGQNVAIVSDIPGTTTDPVKKNIEIYGIGACRFIDTAGFDDIGNLGNQRIEKTHEVISQVDIAIVLISGNKFGLSEENLLQQFKELDIPSIIVHNHSDIEQINEDLATYIRSKYNIEVISFASIDKSSSSEYSTSAETIFDAIRESFEQCKYFEKPMFENIVNANDSVLLICPQDAEAPTGRLILPQVMAIRELLDRKAIVTVIQPESLSQTLLSQQFSLVVTDSSVFDYVAPLVDENIPLTSFSMLLARSKGCFDYYMKGTPIIKNLRDGDKIMLLESCTHPTSCEDIGRNKLPKLFKKYTGKNLLFTLVAGLDKIHGNIDEYALVVQCGGCMITARQLYSRLYPAIKSNVPVTNYGMAIAFMNNIYNRAVKVFN